MHSKAIKADIEYAKKKTPEPEESEGDGSYELVDVQGSDDDDIYHNASSLAKGNKISKQPREEQTTPESGNLKFKTYEGPESVLGKRTCPYIHHYIDDSYSRS